MEEMARIKTKLDLIAFPATKAAAAATITGDLVYDFEGSAYGPIDIFLKADDDSQITDTLTVKAYVSYDGGTTWVLVADYADLANGGGAAIFARKEAAIAYAPRVKLVADFDGVAELAAGHGCQVDVKVAETDIGKRRYIAEPAAPASMGTGETYNGESVYVPNTIDELRKIVVVSINADNAEVTDNVTWKLQSSHENENWFDATIAQTDILAAANSFTEVEVTSDLGKYARIVYITDGTGELSVDHQVSHKLILMY